VTFALSGRGLFCIAVLLISIFLLLKLMPKATAQQVKRSLGDAIANVTSHYLNPRDFFIQGVILGGLFETYLSPGRSRNFSHLS
jgi:hypothetical protein